MIYLIEYDRPKGALVSMREYADSDGRKAHQERLNLELALQRKKVRHELVLLQAENEEILRRAHGRYFESLRDIVESGRDMLKGN